MRFLLETYGAEKTKRYYVGEDPALVFGLRLDQLEKNWWAALDAYKVPRAVELRLALTDWHTPDFRHTRLVGESCTLGFAPLTKDLKAVRYQWRKNGEEISNATQALLELNNLSLTEGDIYTRVATRVVQDSSAALSDVSSTAFGPSQNLQDVWPADTLAPDNQVKNQYSTHPWHSAQFRFTNAEQLNYWHSLLNQYGLLPL